MQLELISRNAQIVSDYYQTHSMREIGEKFGITYERVRQIVVRYEKRTGTHVPRTKPKLPRYCKGCGANLDKLPVSKHTHCLVRKRAKEILISRSKQIEGWLNDRLKGAFWHEIAFSIGKGTNYSTPKNAGKDIQELCYKYLLITNQHFRVPTYWPNGVSVWLQKKAKKYKW